MKQTILTNWTFVRFLRLIIGIAILVQSVALRDMFLGAAGLLFTLMAVFNAGCCGAAGCTTGSKPLKDAMRDKAC